VALLVAAGGFASVEAIVDPWVGTDLDGNPVESVLVRYQVVPAKRVHRVDIRGARGPVRRIVEDGLGIDLGDAWHQDEDVGKIEQQIVRRLMDIGWTRAAATVQATNEDEGVRVAVDIQLGLPQRVGSIRIGGQAPVADREVRAWLREAGVRVGRQVNNREQDAARLLVVDRLRSIGFDRARVNVFIQEREEDNRVGVSVLIAPGPKLTVGGRGRGLPNERILRDVLSLRAGEQITQNSRDDAAERMQEWYSEKGYLDAKVAIDSQVESPSLSTVYVRAKPGRRHWLAKVRWPASAPIDRQSALAVMGESAPETVGNGFPTAKGLEQARAGLLDRLNGMGYLDASLEFSTDEGRSGLVRLPARYGVPVRVDVELEPGPQVRLDGVDVRGGMGLEEEMVKGWIAEHRGAPLAAAAVLDLEQRIVEVYEEAGFLEAATELKTTRDRIKSTARINIRVIPGQPVQLRSVVVRGNRRTKRHVVEREVMLDVGQPVSPSALSDTRSNLYNLDLFRLVSPELMGDDPGSQDLLIRLEERTNILLEAGGGVSTDQGIRTTARATHRNIAGLGHRLTGLGSVGYGWFGDEWRLDTATPVWRAATRYELPYVPGRGGRLVVEGLINESLQEPNWRLSRSGGSVGMKMRLSGMAEAVVDYRVQIRRLVDVDSGMLVNGDPWLSAVGLGEDMEGDPILTSAPRVVSGGSLLLVRDGRDDRFNPRSGGNWSTHLEVGDGVFSGTVTMRATTHVERLIPLGPLVLDLVGRGGIGFAQGRSVTLPLEERFFLGGGSTLRGFQLNSVGPANFTARPEVGHPKQSEPAIDGLTLPLQPAQWVATGGDGMASATVEIRVPLPALGFRKMDGTSIVFFSDTGHVGFLDPSVVTTSRLEARDPLVRSSFGAGLRIATPVGPASFDIGINPNPMAEREEPVFLPHLSLGVL
jgi:outer membrane protein insertion porin family